jgi:GNAT superfamily N-acetyltransferase
MTTSHVALFCGTELAARIEKAEARMMAEMTRPAGSRETKAVAGPFALPLAGGVATFAEPGAPMNKVAGLGFAGPPTSDALDLVERAFAERGSPVQVELGTLADPAVGTLLTERGYRLVGFENVLGLQLGRARPEPASSDIAIARCEPQERDAWIDVMIDGFASPDSEGRPSPETFPRGTLERTMTGLTSAGFVLLFARRAGAIAGGASFRITDGIAQLTGAATLPVHRRRGVQTALLTARLAEAGASGCDLAVITTAAGSKSQENVTRQGFTLLYTRAILVKQPGP